MNLQEIISYPIADFKNFQLTIFSLLMIFITILVAWILLAIIKKLLNNKRTSAKMEKGLRSTIYQLIKYVVVIITITIILESIGVKITLLIAGSAALLVGLGLGIQQLFNDIVSGFILLIERTITVDDIIEVDTIVAKVKEIGLRTSKVETRDNIIIILPNSKLVSENVINWSHNEDYTRFRVNIGVAYGSDVEVVRQVLMETALAHNDITHKPQPIIRFIDFGDSALQFEILFWSKNMFLIENVKRDLRFAINAAFEKNNIQVPFPQQDVYIKKMPDSNLNQA